MKGDLQRYSRQMALRQFGEAAQERLSRARVVLIGCGAIGSVLAYYLVAAGVGRLRIVDRDTVEENNLQRQLLFDERDVHRGLPKAVAAKAHLKRVNSAVKLEAIVADLDAGNAARHLAGADLLLDGTDNLETRFLINDFSVRQGVPWIYCGIVGVFGHTMVVQPGAGPCLRCYLPETPAAGDLPSCESEGIAGPVAAVTAGTAAFNALRLLAGHGSGLAGRMAMYDCWEGSLDDVRVDRRPGCPTCSQRRFSYLEGSSGSRATALCGRQAVQVWAGSESAARKPPCFEELARRLARQGQVSFNKYVLQFRTDRFEISLFNDARAIVKGTADPAVARSLYARYIGT
ncbi:MAG: ThiF family adenylyltransferase [Candidatus Wallbacteria bacterium]|nr:ThiF family adenylyltransferase [Candidatus Wallbacteria bacterium]